jgi:hypothetical protein
MEPLRILLLGKDLPMALVGNLVFGEENVF